MASILKAFNLGHSGKKATKFEFSITLKELMIECDQKRFALLSFLLKSLIISFILLYMTSYSPVY